MAGYQGTCIVVVATCTFAVGAVAAAAYCNGLVVQSVMQLIHLVVWPNEPYEEEVVAFEYFESVQTEPVAAVVAVAVVFVVAEAPLKS